MIYIFIISLLIWQFKKIRLLNFDKKIEKNFSTSFLFLNYYYYLSLFRFFFKEFYKVNHRSYNIWHSTYCTICMYICSNKMWLFLQRLVVNFFRQNAVEYNADKNGRCGKENPAESHGIQRQLCYQRVDEPQGECGGVQCINHTDETGSGNRQGINKTVVLPKFVRKTK